MNDFSFRPDRTHYPVMIIGGGQAGLSMSAFLRKAQIDHLMFERERIGHAWRTNRWDSFCLVTPNWQCQLPDFPYSGSDPQGFMKKDEIVEYVERFAASIRAPVMEGVEVTRLSRAETGGYAIASAAGEFTADQVVVAVGGYHIPSIPRMAERIAADVLQLHSADYRNPVSLPDGAVLVVGTGQSGCQIAEDLHLAGRKVYLCVGGAPRSPRRYRGRDVVDWLHQMGYYDMPIHQHPLKERVRAKANHYLTGRDGGREIDLRKFALEGMELLGRLDDLRGQTLQFRGDLARNLDQADAVAESIKTTIDGFIARTGIEAPAEAPYRPAWVPDGERLELDYRAAGIRSIVWCIGYRSDFRWVELPVFDGRGYPGHERGVTASPGLYFLGLPWLYTWGSGRFSGVARDAAYLAERIESRYRSERKEAGPALNELVLGS